MRNLLFLSILMFLFSCGSEEKGTKVKTAKIKTRNITEKVEGLGKIQPELEVKITSDVAGRIVELNGMPGESVKKGQILAKIEDKNYRAAVERAKSSLKSSEANLQKVQGEWKRSKELKGKGLISDAELEIANANLKIQQASLEQSRASYKEALENLDKCIIRSPIDGIITVKNKEKDEIAQGSGFNLDVIMIVANLDVMETVVDVTESDIVKVKLDQKVDLEIEAFPETIFEGVVTEIANSAKTNPGSSDDVTNFEVTIKILKKNEAFRPGMNVTAAVKTNYRDNAVSVPIQAITARKEEKLKTEKSAEEVNKDSDKDFVEVAETIKENRKLEEVVFVVNNGTVEKRKIEKGISDDDYYEVLAGLLEGDEVVIGPFKTLSTNLKNEDKVLVDNKIKKRRNRRN